jgi:CRP-like cAMP-binding protein
MDPSQVKTRKEGDYFGELALTKNLPRTATCSAAQEGCACYVLGRRRFEMLINLEDVEFR